MFETPIARVRTIGKFEAVSFLLLLGVAMPLKYLAGFALAVKVVGWAHGVLFVALLWAVAAALSDGRLGFKHAFLVVVAALLPFGPFVADKSLAKLDALPEPGQA